MIIFLLPLAVVLILYLVDVGLARGPRDDEEKDRQLPLPLK